MRINFFTPVLFGLLIGGNLISSPHRVAAQQPATLPPPTANPTEADSDTIPAKPQAAALESSETRTANFSDVFERVKKEVAAHGAENVLVVVDIDNTTLAMTQALGSDQWYNWQYNFILKKIQSPYRVAANLDELLQIQGTLFALGKMRPPEPEIPSFHRENSAARMLLDRAHLTWP